MKKSLLLTVLFLINSYAQYIPHDEVPVNGLVAYYPFSGNANDASGNGNHGQPNAGVIWSYDRFGNINNASRFNTSSSLISVPERDQLDFVNNFSFSLWVNSQSYSNNPIILNKHQAGRDDGWFLLINNNKPRFNNWVSYGVFNFLEAKTPLTSNKWEHIAFTFNKSDSTWSFYLNGTLDTTGKAPIIITNTELNFLIGNETNPNGTSYQGDIDDIRLYNRALSQSEIDSLYYEGGYNSIVYGGKTYHTVTIGTQTWMRENLDIGTMIQDNQNGLNNGTIEKYCYDNNPANCDIYGGLYQWNEAMQYATAEGSQGICPTGWHIPTNSELQSLSNAVAGNSNALKAVGQGAGTNTSGFSALMAGFRNFSGGFGSNGYYTYFWSSTGYDATDANLINLHYNNSDVGFGHNNKTFGFSVRCTQDFSTVQLNAPNGGETKLVGVQDTIKWTSTGVTNVKIELTTNNGTDWSTVVASTPASTESYVWTVPNTRSLFAKIRIGDVGNSSVSDLSDYVFSIVGLFTEMADIPLIDSALQNALWGDYDNDGDLDLLFYGDNYTPDDKVTARIYRNSNGTFEEINPDITNGFNAWGGVSWADIDGDGDLDILIGGQTVDHSGWQHETRIYRNENGVFINTNAQFPNMDTHPSGIAWGDYDNDNDLDLLINGYEGWGWPSYVFRNDNGIFTKINANLDNGGNMGLVAWIDYDNDGDLDIIQSGRLNTGDYTKIYQNNSGSFTKIVTDMVGGAWGYGSVGDFDNDTDMDWIVSTVNGSNEINKVELYKNSDGSFSHVPANFIQAGYGRNKWFDYDNDGDLDLLITGMINSQPYIKSLSFLYRNENNSFVLIDSTITGVYQSGLDVGDYDNDGDLDVVVSGWNSSNGISKGVSNIFRNNIITGSYQSNTPPTAPTSLRSQNSDKDVILFWAKSNDMQTPQNGLSYNLRVGTTPGGSQIMSAMANLATGKRLLPGMGNTNLNNSWVLRNLLAGTYYWSVQAIDNTYAGSAFTAEQSFTIIGEITLHYPNNGENTIAGTLDTIKWSSVGVANVKIELTTNNGSSWTTLIASTPASAGKYVWNVPNTPSEQCKIRISDASNSALNDVSGVLFRILRRQITLLSPSGGETWQGGTEHVVSWSSLGVSSVKLEYSTDGGGRWLSFCLKTDSSTTSYIWLLPNTPSGNCLLRISDLQDNTVKDSLSTYFNITSSSPVDTFYRRWGGKGSELIKGIVETDGGHFMVIGETGSYGMGLSDIYVARLDAYGVKIWERTFGGNYGYSITKGIDGGFLLGCGIGDTAYIIKIDDFGEKLWQKKFPNIRETIQQVKITKDGNYILVGWGNQGGSDAILCKTDLLGNEIWNKGYTTQLAEFATSVTQTNDGGYVGAGFDYRAGGNYNSLVFKTNEFGVLQWERHYGGSYNCLYDVVTSLDGNYLVCGADGPYNYNKGHLVKHDDAGNTLWSKTFSFLGSSTLTALKETPDLGILTTGSTAYTGGQKLVLLKTDANGNTAWQKYIGDIDTLSFAGMDVILQAPDKYVVVGLGQGAKNNSDFLIVKGSYPVPPSIKVWKPNGGETKLAGSQDTIRWTSTVVSDVKIEFTTNNGTNWTTITESISAGSLYYAWTIPNTVSPNCKVRISDASNANVSDMSDNTFKIILENGLVAYYPLNGEANDESGYENNGTKISTSMTIDRFGNVDKAFNFDGTNSYINIPNSSSISVTTEATFAVWVYPRTMTSHTAIFEKGNTDADPSYMLLTGTNVEIPNKRVFRPHVARSPYDWAGGAIDFDCQENNWYLVVWTYKSETGELKGYINGREYAMVYSNPNAQPQPGQTFRISSAPLLISKNTREYVNLFNGILDDFRIYNRTLSAEEISSLYYEGGYMPPPINPTNLIAVAGNSTIGLKWNKSADKDIKLYRIYQGTTANPITKIDSVAYTDTVKTLINLTNGQIYYYRITAVDSSGEESGYSNEVQIAPTIVAGGLVAYYPFSGSPNDGSGNVRNGTVTGAVSYSDRFQQSGNAYKFNGSSNVDIGKLGPINDYTVSGWFKKEQRTGYPDTHLAELFGTQNPVDGNKYFKFGFHSSYPDHLKYHVSNGGQNFSNGHTIVAITDNLWHFISVIRSGASIRVVLDGVEQTLIKDSSGTAGNEIHTDMPTMIGNVGGEPNQGFNGVLDDFRVYNRVLTEAEIDSLALEGGYNFAPGTPNLTAGAGNQSVSLKWNKGWDKDIRVFRIYQGTSPNPTTKVDSVSYTDSTKQITSLTNGQIYYFRVTAVDSSGQESGFSNEVQIAPTVVASGLVAYYPFSGNANDGSGNNNNGTVNGAVQNVDRFGSPAKAFSFDGLSNDIKLTGTFGGHPEFTISSWINATEKPNDYYAAVLSSKNFGEFLHFQVSDSSPSAIAIYTTPQGFDFTPAPNVSPLNRWKHMVLVIKSGETKYYENGTLIKTFQNTFTNLTASSNVKIGSGFNDGRFFKGTIDDIRMYNRALNAQEVDSLLRENGWNPVYVNLFTPMSGETLQAGKQYNITWASANVQNVKLELTTNNGTDWQIITSVTPAAGGAFQWSVPAVSASQCKIRITDAANSSIINTMAGTFSIINPQFSVTSPNGGEQWLVGSVQNITWGYSQKFASPVKGNGKEPDAEKGRDGGSIGELTEGIEATSVKIDYSTNNGATWTVIAASVPISPGTYAWTVPDKISTQAKIRISDPLDSMIYDISDAVFTIYKIGITVTSPNGGEVLQAKSQHEITWSYFTVPQVNIDFTTNNGQSWTSIASNVDASALSYMWDVPELTATQARVKISSASNAAVFDISDNLFSIVNPRIQVIAPNGGEKLAVGSVSTIQWSYFASKNKPQSGGKTEEDGVETENVRIQYSVDGGATWLTVASGVPVTSLSYNWTVPNTPTSSGKIKITDAANGGISDLSDNTFRIYVPFNLASVYPEPNKANVADTAKVEFLFNQAFNVSTVDTQSVIISGSQYGLYRYLKTVSANKLTLQPLTPFKNGEKIMVTLTRRILSAEGDSLSKSFTFTFNIRVKNSGSIYIVSDTISSISQPYALTPLDYDKNGDIDLASGSWAGGQINIFGKNINNKFEKKFSFGAGSKTTAIRALDLENDGDADLMSPNFDLTSVSVLENQGQNSFMLTQFTAGQGLYAMDAGDINGDGYSDVVFVDDSRNLSAYVSNKNRTFTKTSGFTLQTSSSGVGGIALADIDRDGDFDIVVSSGESNLRTYINNGSGVYTLGTTFASGGTGISSVRSADLNSDGYPDIAACNYNSSLVSVFFNSGTGTFSNPVYLSTGDQPLKLQLNDFNSDGLIDIAVGHSFSNYIRILKNNGNGTFSVQQDIQLGFFQHDFVAADLTNTGFLSFGVANLSGNRVYIVRNNDKYLALASPNGGEQWQAGTTATISWNSGSIANVKIELSTNNGSSWTTIAASVAANALSYQWTIPQISAPECLIRISDASDATLFDQSDNFFSVINPQIALTAPNGGENWLTGSVQNITWSYTTLINAVFRGNNDNDAEKLKSKLSRNDNSNKDLNSSDGPDALTVKLEYTTNNGQNWLTIASSLPASDGTYAWTVPNTPGTQAKVRVSDAANSVISDMSNAVFTIYTTGVTLTRPNGGETWASGAVESITWASSGVTNVKLEYTTNNGTAWSTIIASTTAAAGSYNWTVPSVATTEAKVRVSDAANALINDMSDNVFTINNSLPVFTVKIRTDSIWYDKNYDGTEVDTLDGTGSTVSTGSIVDYIWFIDGEERIRGTSQSVELQTGTHIVKLRVVSNTGHWAEDSVKVHVFVTRMSTGGAILAGVAQLGNQFYVTSYDKAVYKFDSTGTGSTPFFTGGVIQSTLCISNKKVIDKNIMFVGSSDSRIYAFKSDLEVYGNQHMGGIILSSPAVSSDGAHVYAGNNAGKLYSWEANLPATPRWSFQADGAIISSPVVLELSKSGRIIFFGTSGTSTQKAKLYAVKDQGNSVSLLWAKEVDDSILSSPAILENGTTTMIYFASRDGYLYRVRWDGYNLANWRKYIGGNIVSSPVIDDKNTVYIASSNGQILGFDGNFDLNSQPVKKYYQPQGINGTPGIGPDGTLFVGCDNGVFLALNRNSLGADMTVKWKFEGKYAIKAPALVTASGKVFIGDMKGDVYILTDPNIAKYGSFTEAQYKWPTFKGNNMRSMVVQVTDASLPPVLLSPLNNSISMMNRQTLYWNPVDSALGYKVQLSTRPDFAEILMEDTTVSTFKALAQLDFNTEYYWRAQTLDRVGYGEFSAPFTFKTALSGARTVSLVSTGGNPGDSVTIPVNITGFQNVGAITLRILYDQTKLSFGRALNWHPDIQGLAGASNGVITIAWDNINGATVQQGKLVDLKFHFSGSDYSVPFSFETNLCEVSDINGAILQVAYTNGAIGKGSDILGRLVYHKPISAGSESAPVPFVSVDLTSNGSFIDSANANAVGEYGFFGRSNGIYNMRYRVSQPWGGVNSTDALQLRRWLVNLVSFTPLQIRAADVNNSGSVNSTDALQIRRRLVNLITSFAIPDWVFIDTIVTLSGSPVTKTDTVLCAGDMNASYIPAILAKQFSSVSLAAGGVMTAENLKKFDMPVSVSQQTNLGAVTLYLKYDSDKLTVTSVTTALDGALYSIKEGLISLAWDDIDGMEFSAGETLLQLSVSMKEDQEFSADMISLSDGSEFADKEGNVVPVTLSYPALAKSVPKEYSLLQNYPNPFNPRTLIRYELPEESYVRIEIFSSSGEKVDQLVNGYIPAGSQQVEWNAEKQPSGIYFYKMTAASKNGSTSYRMTRKMVLIK